MAATDPPSPAPNGNGAGTTSPAEVMVGQLTELLAGWEAQALALAERGIDPRPLLRALAGNLRTIADQLDAGLAPPDDD